MPANRHALWSGSVTFGLVAVPVALVPAAHSSRSAFHLLHRSDHSRLARRMFCPQHKTFVHPEHILRGYEVEPEKYIIVHDSEIEAISPKRSKTIEIAEFVDVDQIDPALYDRPYYLVPTGADKPYQLLVETLARLRKSGIGQFVMHAQQYLAAIESIDGALCLITLRYSEQLRSSDEIVQAASAKASDVKAMRTAIGKAAGHFKPESLSDEYQERIDALIARKKKQHALVEVPHAADEEPQEEGKAKREEVDLVAALEESLARAKESS
ncbi:MAG: Ku protein [Planctomycetaceae bacterium]|nr:Ku protein [Planctomycetaceae bacterium]